MTVEGSTQTPATDLSADEQVQTEGHAPDDMAEHAGHDVHLPPESLWPITAAFAITIAGLGLVTTWLVSVPGIFLFAVALRGWSQELLHGEH